MNVKTKKIIIVAAIALAVVAGVTALVIFVGLPAVNYGKAGSLEKKGDLPGAYEAYERMADYRDAQDARKKLQDQVIASRSQANLSFGGYEWLVLEERDGKMLLLMEQPLDAAEYHTELNDVTWENSAVRGWLNNTFYNQLPQEDKARVVETTVVNSANAEYGTAGGKDTKDRVFLLSLAEAGLYFPSDSARQARYNGSAKFWWLRSPGQQPYLAAIVKSDGALGFAGSGVNYNTRWVRPALWITKG